MEDETEDGMPGDGVMILCVPWFESFAEERKAVVLGEEF